MTEVKEVIGKINVVFETDGKINIETDFNVPDFNLALDHLKALVLSGSMEPEVAED